MVNNETVAVNLCDLDLLRGDHNAAFDPVALLLRDFVSDHSYHVEPNKHRWDSAAMVLDGPATDDPERLAALVEFLQTVLGPRKLGRRARCYRRGPRGGWPEIRPKTEMK